MELKIGEKIAKYRKLKGYTQEQLGELVGVSGQAVSKWENGGVPDTYLLPTISKVLGVSIDALFGVEKKISDYSQDEILDDLFMFCRQKTYYKDDKIDFFKFLFETIWTLQSAYFGNESRPILRDVIENNCGNQQITSQIINNEGTTYLSLVESFPFFCAVSDTPEIQKNCYPKRTLESSSLCSLWKME